MWTQLMDYQYFKLIKIELEYTFLELIFVGGLV